MQMLTRLHDRLARSDMAVGAAVGLNSPTSAELLVHNTELDFIIVDLQHVPVTPPDAVHLLRAVQAADPQATPMVRLPNHDVYWIQQALDAGFLGLIAPLCESAQQAQALVNAVYFPPEGARSVAGNIRATLYDDYMSLINEHVVLLPQIESPRGLENAEAIVSVPGVSGLLIGPADLSLSCGWSGQDLWTYKAFLAAVQRITNACCEHEKICAIITAGESVFQARKTGIDFICVSADAYHIRTSMSSDVNEIARRLRDSET